MSRGDEQRIADILDACAELAAVVDLKDARAAPDQVLLRAAERLLEIIGEAASNVSDAGPLDYALTWTGAPSRGCGSCWRITTTAPTPT